MKRVGFASSGSTVTSGSDESGILWLTDTQIIILDSDHLWLPTNNVKCQGTAAAAGLSCSGPCCPDVVEGSEPPSGKSHGAQNLLIPLGPQKAWPWRIYTHGCSLVLLLGKPGWEHTDVMAAGLGLNPGSTTPSAENVASCLTSLFPHWLKQKKGETVIKIAEVYWNFLWVRHCSKQGARIISTKILKIWYAWYFANEETNT